MGKYDNNPIIEGRYDAYGRQTYWAMGYKGQGVKVAVIDDYGEDHGYMMASTKEYIGPECILHKLDMRGNKQGMIEMFREALRLKVNIISLSRYIDNDDPELHAVVKACDAAGILMFCSAGNQGDKYGSWVDIKQWPAAYPETISCLCLDNSFMPSAKSSHSSTGIITGFGQNVLVMNKLGEEMLVSGTSPTTAALAFTAALHWSRYLSENGKHPTVQYMKDFIISNSVDFGATGKDNFTGFGFFTLDKTELERVRLMILDTDKNGLSQRLDEIKSLVNAGVPLEQAEKQVNAMYYIVGPDITNGVVGPLYGGKKPW